MEQEEISAKINSERVYGVLADQCPSMELDLNEVSRVSAPRIFEFTIAEEIWLVFLLSLLPFYPGRRI
jgi:hypothetical protein